MYTTADFLVIWSLTVLVLRPRIKVPLGDADSAFDRTASLAGHKRLKHLLITADRLSRIAGL
jgi:hypothetical protein